jgi:hypothetical protein
MKPNESVQKLDGDAGRNLRNARGRLLDPSWMARKGDSNL